jgi:hypothetical protein
VRQSDFYPQSLERSTRSERDLKLSLAEMYVQGVSTRKVKAITEQLCGFEVPSSQVSRVTSELDSTSSGFAQEVDFDACRESEESNLQQLGDFLGKATSSSGESSHSRQCLICRWMRVMRRFERVA